MKNLALISLLFFTSFSLLAQENQTSDSVSIGLSTTDLEPLAGTPLAGFGSPKRRVKGFIDLKGKHPYSFFFAPSKGQLDPIYTRAMVVRKNNKLVVFVSADFTGITSDFVNELAKRLKPYGVTRDNLFVSGTHTHSGPGALSKRFALAILAADLFNKKVFNHIMGRVVSNVEKAFSLVQPAYLYDLTYKTINLQKNRRERPGHFDSNARLLLAKNLQGDWLGGILNYAIHGTALGGSNLHFSGDVPGAIVSTLEIEMSKLNLLTDKLPTVLFINGAEGDVAPIRGGLEGMKEISTSFAAQTLAVLDKARPVLNPIISYQTKRIWVGFPKVNIKACIDDKKLRKFISKFLSVPLVPLMPMKASISQVNIGDLTFLTWPGEPTTDIGYQLQQLAKDSGREYPWVLGLTNDYLAYFTTKEEFKNGGYEACSSLYSYRGGRRILKNYKKILNN